MKTLCCLLLAVVALASAAHAESWRMPRVDERQLQLSDTGQVALEIMAGQILSLTGPRFSGSIRLVWVDDGFAGSARMLRSMLISKGIAPERVVLAPESGGYQRQAVSGLEIRIRQIVLRLPDCHYAEQNYRFDYRDDLGCALNNTRSAIISNPNKFYF